MNWTVPAIVASLALSACTPSPREMSCISALEGSNEIVPGKLVIKTTTGTPLIAPRLWGLADGSRSDIGNGYWSYLLQRWWTIPAGEEAAAKRETVETICALRRWPWVEVAEPVGAVVLD